MSKEAETDNARGLSDCRSRSEIRIARFRITVRVVVGDREGAAVVAQDGVQDLAHRHKRSVDRPVGDGHALTDTIRGIAHEYQNPLSPYACQLLTSDARDVLRSSQHGCLMLNRESAPAQLEGSHER